MAGASGNVNRGGGSEPTSLSGNPPLYPFGLPDGKPGDVEGRDPLDDFVPVTGRSNRRDLGMDADERRVRIIVGRKGAGKTLYLRRLQATAALDKSLYVDKWRIDLPSTPDVIRVYDISSSAIDAVERWEKIWSRAILRSLVSHLLHAPQLRERIRSARSLLETGWDHIYTDYGACSSPYNEAANIFYERFGKGRPVEARNLDEYLADPLWNTLEETLAPIVSECPVICFYLDALDGHFESVPIKWLACQKGLCLQVMHLADKWPRLHVVITIRDLVYTALKSGEHRTRLERNERIRLLDWDEAAIDELLRVKIDGLHPDHLLLRDASNPIERWLGLRRIRNSSNDKVRGRDPETLRGYLLRHTRLIPRDIVQLGNALCGAIDDARDRGTPSLVEASIRKTVSDVAAGAGDEELMIVANHITTAGMPPWSVEMGIEELYYRQLEEDRGEEGLTWQHFLRDHLLGGLRELREDRFTTHKLKRFLEFCQPQINGADVVSILWQHGLLGYIDGRGMRTRGQPIFYSSINTSPMYLAQNRSAYALHPIMIDTVGPPMKGIGEVVRAHGGLNALPDHVSPLDQGEPG